MSGQRRAWYLRCGPDDVADRAVLVGDRGRVHLAAEHLDDVRVLNEDRGLTTATGSWRDTPVTVSAFGMGAPIAAVVLHELAQLGVHTVLRLGTVMCLPPARLGDLVLAEGAIRGESTSATYVPDGYPAVADLALTVAVRDRLRDGDRAWCSGLVASYDGFYPQLAPGLAPDAGAGVDHGRLRGLGVLALDMETSAVLAVGRALGVRAGSLCLASVDAATRDRLDPDRRIAAEHELVVVGLDALTAPRPQEEPAA